MNKVVIIPVRLNSSILENPIGVDGFFSVVHENLQLTLNIIYLRNSGKYKVINAK